ncbi:NAD-dependent epimerase/dehydratase family protein [Sphingobium sp. CR28]|uniref:NAD-dependent epimerase/dehydratase family protein n=1 Tax=Sphingobium sp. CR28 TaxID=3400272 RepID=UPI003FEDD363
MSRKILVTGAAGFLGRYLMRRVRDSSGVAIGTSGRNADADLYHCDITDERQVAAVIEAVQPDVIIHCAAISSVTAGKPLQYYMTNVIGTENILRGVQKVSGQKVRFMFISTAGVYGNQESDVLHEDLCPSPVHHYGMSKFCAEKLMKNYEDFIDFTVIRPFNIIGRGQNEDFVVPKLAEAFRSRQKSIQLGNVEVYRDYMDVYSACDCIVRLIDAPRSIGKTVNLCTGQPTSLRELIDMFSEITGHTIKIERNENLVRRNEVWKLIGDNGRLTDFLDRQILKTDVLNVLRSMLA